MADGSSKPMGFAAWLAEFHRPGIRPTDRLRFDFVRYLLTMVKGQAAEFRRLTESSMEPIPDAISEATGQGDSPADMLTPKAAARLLGVTQDTLRNWRLDNSDGPSYVPLPSGHVRYRRDDVEAYIAGRRVVLTDPLIVAAQTYLPTLEKYLSAADEVLAAGSNQPHDRPGFVASVNDMVIPADAAVILGVTVAELREWRSHNLDGPPYHAIACGQIRYKRGDLEAYLSSRRVVSAAGQDTHAGGVARESK